MADISELVKSEISDFCAGLESPGRPETPEEIQRELMGRILPLIKDERREWMARGAEKAAELINIAADEFPESVNDIASECSGIASNTASKIRAGEVTFREIDNSTTETFREISETTTNCPEIPDRCMEEHEVMRRAIATMITEQRQQEPDFFVVVTSAGICQSFHKYRADAEFITSKPFNPGYSILEIYTAPPVPVIKLPDDIDWNDAFKLLDIRVCGEDRIRAFMMGANWRLAETKRLNGLGE
ncbi:hypothetical protein [Tatumella sp. UCD-D_suzukii]|uniref:hypothetical protein n=1 Tax=Tatumella sp. UCD-D_suzukii TaxID=1408192 RepID=UPI0004716278|nr:hypothetical protein [Tatumella sp. UCD-D_suzukii]